MPASQQRTAWWLLGVGLAFGAVVRVVFARVDDGLWWPDEFYQSLEPAHRLVFGTGWEAWEFRAGARHWTLPGLVAGLFWLAKSLSLPHWGLVEAFSILVSLVTSLGVYALGRAADSRPLPSAAAAVCSVLMGLSVYASSRAMGETWCTAPLVWGLALSVSKSKRAQLAAGVLLSLAVALRLQTGLFCLGAVAWAWRQHRALPRVLMASLFAGAVALGLVDFFTWGRPFHSALTYLTFNVIEGRASEYGTAPWWYYLKHATLAEGLTLWPALMFAAYRRSWPLALAVLFMAVHCFIPHKELRFLYPAIPLLMAGTAVGLSHLNDRASHLVVALGIASLFLLPTLTFYRMGVPDMPPGASAFDFAGPENRLLQLAGRRTDVCGVRIDSVAHWRTAGYTAFHAAAPLYRVERLDESVGHFNYQIGIAESVTGEVVARDGAVVLAKVGLNCTPDPSYRWQLE